MTALCDPRPHDLAHVAAEVAWPRQPFDPPSGEQVRRTGDLLRRDEDLPDSTRFVTVALHEPSKDAVLAGHGVDDLPREACALVLDRRGGQSCSTSVSGGNAWPLDRASRSCPELVPSPRLARVTHHTSRRPL